jgi:2-aminoethylphosphonate-pyruvate transaminase
VGKPDYECVIMQGSGTFGIESVISCAIGKNDALLVVANGAYGERIVKMAEVHGIKHAVLRFPEDEAVDVKKMEAFLESNTAVTHVACIHSETTTGLFNDIQQIGKICQSKNKVFIVDAMSSFGGTDIPVKGWGIDFLVSSSNKCIEGVPGFSFVIAESRQLQNCKGQARTLSLDLHEQWKGLETNGQFRFTPPTLSIMAFRQALVELEAEGGVKAREARYRKNKSTLDSGMIKLGFKAYLNSNLQGHIITSFLYPDNPKFNFESFYQKLSDRGFVIYPGKLTKANAFRIGTIGQIFPEDVQELVKAIEALI